MGFINTRNNLKFFIFCAKFKVGGVINTNFRGVIGIIEIRIYLVSLTVDAVSVL